MSYRSKRERGSNGRTTCMVLWMVLIAVLIPAILFQTKTVEPNKREPFTEGVITEKNIERGYGSAYIFVLNGTTDIAVYKWQYNSFSVGDYIEVYIVLFGYDIVRR